MKKLIQEYIENNIIITLLVSAFVGCVTGFSAFGYPLSGVIVGFCSVLISYSVIFTLEQHVIRIENITDEQTDALVDAIEGDILEFERKFMEEAEQAPPPHQR